MKEDKYYKVYRRRTATGPKHIYGGVLITEKDMVDTKQVKYKRIYPLEAWILALFSRKNIYKLIIGVLIIIAAAVIMLYIPE